jgi:paraquat-inducible protein B
MLRKLFILGFIFLTAQACRSNTLEINVHFDELYGLAKNDRVLFNSNTAGIVETIHFNQDGTYVLRLQIDKGFGNAVTEYSSFSVVDDTDRPGHKAVAITLQRAGGKPLPDGASVTGTSTPQDLVSRLQKDVENGFNFFKDQIEKFSDDLKKVPESEEYRHLKRSLSDLADKLTGAEKGVRDRLKKEWLPKIEEEIESFKRQMRDLGREDEAKPLQKELERIRKI